jgi:hypothetical protein
VKPDERGENSRGRLENLRGRHENLRGEVKT